MSYKIISYTTTINIVYNSTKILKKINLINKFLKNDCTYKEPCVVAINAVEEYI